MKNSVFEENLIKKLGVGNFKKVQSAKIGIAGAGGLGSNCALNLVRAGFGNLKVVDFDTIDPSNLDRQFYFADQVGLPKTEALAINLLRVNPAIRLDMIYEKIEKGSVRRLFGDCDAVAECLDTPEAKSMLVSELMKMKIFTVTVSGLGGIGASDEIKTHRLKDNLVMIGDLRSDICSKPALSPRVNIAAAKQADVVLEYVCSRKDPTN